MGTTGQGPGGPATHDVSPRAEDRRYRSLVDATAHFVWIAAPDGGVLHIDDEWLHMVGLALEDALGWQWLAVIHADDRDAYSQAWRAAIGHESVFEFEYRLHCAHGGVRWFFDRAVPVHDDHGRLVEWIGAGQDITERKEAEQELAYVSGLQQILVELSGQLVATEAEQLDAVLDTALARVGQYCDVDRSFVFRFEEGAARMSQTHEWCAPGIAPTIDRNRQRPRGSAPRLVASMEQRQVLHVPRVGDLGAEWSQDRALFDAEGLQSFILVPLVVGSSVEGYLGFDAVRQQRSWSVAEIRLLRGLADVVGATIHRSHAEARLRENQALLEIAGRTARLGGWRVDLPQEHVVFSDEARAIRELPPDHEPTAVELLNAYAPGSRERIRERYLACVRDGIAYDEELEFVTAGGRHIWVREIGEPVRDDSGAIVQVRGSSQDITERKRAEEEIRHLAGRLSNTLESITDALYTLDREWRFTYVNREAERVLHRDRETLLGAVIWEQFEDVVGTVLEHEYRRAMRDQRTVEFELYYPPVETWFEIHAYPSDEGLAVYFRDITEQKRVQAEIEFLALYDPLTQLPNRRLLLDRLQHALASSHRSGTNGAVLFLDLDDFKTLNDTLGHDFGDRLLQQAASRLTDCLRESDTVARFGGDEFAVVVVGLGAIVEEATEQAMQIGEKIRTELTRPYRLGDSERHLTVSVGVTVFGGAEDTADDLMKQADLAMYQAKEAGRGTLRVFEPAMHAAIHSRVAMEAALRTGLQRGEIEPYYQPQVDHTGRFTGAEALARWMHPERGLVSPGQFIPVAEETGLILPLGDAILEAACTQVAAWATRPGMEHLDVAVNISARQFHHPDFVTRVLALIERTGADPRKLWLELTETLLIADVEDTITKMTRLKAEGIRFSLDDFGTGYSSLAYLKRLPLDVLKIDQSFVRDALTDPNDEAIVRTIIVLAQTMGIGVVAEGVETEEVRALLAGHGCLNYQGYLFGHPLPAERFDELVRQNGPRADAPETAGPG